MWLKNTNSFVQNLRRIWSAVAFILMVPLVAMLFTDEVNWDVADFVVMGALLSIAGFIYELVARKVGNRTVVGLIVAVFVLLIWAELAVGIFGSPFAGS